ncbi:MAG: hypothetical protein SGI84_03660 [Gemmatimonadota bacterium]|nr:hypothetical protein [Gemmatimonadota bacterium]
MLNRIALALAVLALGLTAPAYAQGRSAVTGVDLDAAVAAAPAGNRAAVQAFLTTDQARTVAARLGVNTADLSASVGTIDQASLDLLAQRTGVADAALAGGDSTVVISTTAIIIALLILILLSS